MTFTAQEFRIINAHTHIFPHKLAEKAAKSIGDFYGIPMNFSGEVDKMLEDGRPFGVEKYLVCSTATSPNQVHSINDFIADQCKEHEEFIGFATLHPALENLECEIQRAISLGLKGIKLHPDFQRFDIDDPAAMPIYELSSAYKLPVLFHMGDDRYDYSRPFRLKKIAENFKELVCIGAHFGGYRRWDEAYDLLKIENVFMDTSSSLAFLSKEKALALIGRMGDEKLFFGTDFPMWSHAEEFERIFALGLKKQQYENIFFTNFASLMGID